MSELDDLVRLQSGVISRRQAHQLGLQPHDIERKLRRREWVRLFAGVFIDHTGEPSWHQRAWAGVLYYWPAALGHDSALRAYSGAAGRSGEPIELVVDRHHTLHLSPAIGFVGGRVSPKAFGGTSLPHGSPSRTRRSTSPRTPHRTSPRSRCSPRCAGRAERRPRD